jgi:pyrroline-5-carboxylate reductase
LAILVEHYWLLSIEKSGQLLMKLGFIGTGAISEAIILGLVDTDFPVSEVIVSARNRTISAQLAEKFTKVRVSDNNQDIIDSSDLIFLAVRPQDAETVLSSLRFRDNQQVASLIATLPIEQIQEWTGPSAVITRAIPLPFVSEKAGVTAIYPDSKILTNLFASLGTVVVAKTSEEFDAFGVAGKNLGCLCGRSGAQGQHCDRGNEKCPQSHLVSPIGVALIPVSHAPDWARSLDRVELGLKP